MNFAKIIYRQWKRSNLLGFAKRMGQYILGQRCYTTGCKDRMLLVELVVRHWVFERWYCEGCKASKGDLY